MRLIHVVSSDQRSRKKKRVITVNYTPMIGQDLEKLRISMRWRTKISDVVRSIKRLLIKLINRKGDNSI